MHECSFCSEAEMECADQEALVGVRCVSSQGFLPALPQARSMALLPLTRHVPHDLPTLKDKVTKTCPLGNMKLHPKSEGMI